MNVLLVSQCNKNALKETRRILDQFAERRGDRTWQTAITKAGLDTLRKMLRKTARKNTAVACHWIRGVNHSELLWLVGNASRFNMQGAVPTNITRRDVLRSEDENDWHTGEDIRLLAQLAALLHDFGKASVAFQQRLRGERRERNLYRHEWVSLRLFQAFVGADDDAGWLTRLVDANAFDEQAWLATGRYQRDGLDAQTDYPFRDLPPLAAAIGWLLVSHHRLPVVPATVSDGECNWVGKRATGGVAGWLQDPLRQITHTANEIRQDTTATQAEPYWQPAGPLPVVEPKWRAQAARLAKGLLKLQQKRGGDWLGNSYVMHLARLSLMLADHYYSSLPKDSPQRVKAGGTTSLYACTDQYGDLKQPLDEHLLGVARSAGLIAHALPGFERNLPRLANHRGLRKRSADRRFAWQDKAYDAARSMRDEADKQGAFVINMASTGCGKTLANARVLYALANEQQGLRATYALGLRTLTLQTGRSYRKDLSLGADELAVQVGGSASRSLFEYYQNKAADHGSASLQSLLEEDSHVLYEGNMTDDPLLSRALHDPAMRKLLSAPMLVCTVDHIVPATESLRGGRQIAPMLRLMSADLILDELDDYGLEDMPALTRLVHWAGMLGTRVVLSSATLPPSLVTGMYLAYSKGRKKYQRNRGADGARPEAADATPIEVPCLWVDEFNVQRAVCAGGRAFDECHAEFVRKRCVQLQKAEPVRRGELLPLALQGNKPQQCHAEFASHVRDACLRLHNDHAQTDPASDKRVSFGLVRMANIDPLFDVAQQLYALGAPQDTHIHLCVYHARLPLLQRSEIEHQLDAAFNRRGDENTVYTLPAIRKALDAHEENNQLFIVLASPVCEVGRDWDADWAVVEPSSMRSLIQLAGRVQRHRNTPAAQPNMLVFDTNLRHFKAVDGKQPVFAWPGYEKAKSDFLLNTHSLQELLQTDEYQVITALPRVRSRPVQQWDHKHSLVDLEQARTATAMLPQKNAAKTLEDDHAFVAWRYPNVALTGVLPQQQPFRDDPLRTTTLVFLPEDDTVDDEDTRLLLHRVEPTQSRREPDLYIPVETSQRHDVELAGGVRITPWGNCDLAALLLEQAERLDLSVRRCAERMASVEVPESKQGWRYHPLLGFGKEQ